MRISEFKDPFTGRRGIYLFTTDHLERTLLFRDEEDFVQGVNSLAFATLLYPVKVLCYVLMDNHIHLLVIGRYEDCCAFYAWVLHRLARIIEEKYGVSGILKLQSTDVQAVTDKEMLLKSAICCAMRTRRGSTVRIRIVGLLMNATSTLIFRSFTELPCRARKRLSGCSGRMSRFLRTGNISMGAS